MESLKKNTHNCVGPLETKNYRKPLIHNKIIIMEIFIEEYNSERLLQHHTRQNRHCNILYFCDIHYITI